MVKHTLGEGLAPRVRAKISSETWGRGGGRGGEREEWHIIFKVMCILLNMRTLQVTYRRIRSQGGRP